LKFDIEHIDNGVELQVRQIVEALGYWPNQTQFFKDDDEPGFDAALTAAIAAQDTQPLIKVFGPGGYRDREQLMENNIVISRTGIQPGDIGFSNPIAYEEYSGAMSEQLFRKVQTEEGTKNISYDIRFFCNNTDLDRAISDILIRAFSTRKYVYGQIITEGPNSITNTTQGFWVFPIGDPVELSSMNYIERLYRFLVVDVCLEDNVTLYEGIPPMTVPVIEVAPGPNDCIKVGGTKVFVDGVFECGVFE